MFNFNAHWWPIESLAQLVLLALLEMHGSAAARWSGSTYETEDPGPLVEQGRDGRVYGADGGDELVGARIGWDGELTPITSLSFSQLLQMPSGEFLIPVVEEQQLAAPPPRASLRGLHGDRAALGAQAVEDHLQEAVPEGGLHRVRVDPVGEAQSALVELLTLAGVRVGLPEQGQVEGGALQGELEVAGAMARDLGTDPDRVVPDPARDPRARRLVGRRSAEAGLGGAEDVEAE